MKEKETIERLKYILKQIKEGKVKIEAFDLFGSIETVLNLIEEKDKKLDEIEKKLIYRRKRILNGKVSYTNKIRLNELGYIYKNILGGKQ